MSSALHDVVSGALFHETRMNTLANNIANISTSGFKEDRVFFELPGENNDPGTSGPAVSYVENPQDTYLGNPVRTYTNFTSGQVVYTGNPLDLSLQGSGFFKIDTPEGLRYTRAGNFTLNADKTLVTSDGYPVLGAGGEITIEDGKGLVEVDMDGNILVGGSSVGQLEIADFPDPSLLLKAGANTFSLAGDDVEEQPTDDTTVIQGAVEHANVDPVKSMTEMIEVLRGYESYQKIIQYLDETDGKIIEAVGRR